MKLIKSLTLTLITFFLYFNHLFGGPSVNNVNPFLGSVTGGNPIDISGSGFIGATNVNFGLNPAVSYIVNSDTSITAINPPGSAGTVNVSITTPSGTSSETSASLFTYQGVWFDYVTSEGLDSVTPIDIATNTSGPLIPVGTSPYAIAITPDGKTAYVTNGFDTTVTPIDIATNTPGTPINVTSRPFGIAISPDGITAYVACANINSIIPIDIATNTTNTPLNWGNDPFGLAITPDGQTAYVLNNNLNTVTPITIATNTLGTPIVVGSNPYDIAITPDGKKAYVANISSANVTCIDITTNTVETTIIVGNGPFSIAITPNGTTAYVSNNFVDTVTAIDISTNIAVATINGGAFSGPAGIAITPDSKTAYVSNNNSTTVTPITIATNTPNAPIAVGDFPNGSAITPDQAPVSSFTFTPPLVGSPTTFDASNSVTPVGTIVSYFWDFGDGQTTTTASPIIPHTYSSAGIFNVSLTVTNSAGTSTVQVFTGQTVSNNGSILAISSQVVNISNSPPLPPSNFIGVLKKNKFLNRTEYVLKAKWDASPSTDVVVYRIYKNGHLVDEIPAGSPLVFRTCLDSKNAAKKYQIVAVSSDNLESVPVYIRIVHD
jgi:YVTN family beta-propeller protein